MIVVINNKKEPLNYFSGFNTLCCNVEDIQVRNEYGFSPLINKKPIYFVSPANSLLYMDGGIDFAYSRMFRNVQNNLTLQQALQKKLNTEPIFPTTKKGRKYLPVGGALLFKINEEYSLIAAPTMFVPEDVRYTKNAYYAMKAILKVWPANGTLIVPILAGGVGRIPPNEVYIQMKNAINECGNNECGNNECGNNECGNNECGNNECGLGGGSSLDIYLPPLNELKIIKNQQPKTEENKEFIEEDV